MELVRLEKIYKALGDVTRVRILNILFTGKQFCVDDFQKILEEGQSKVSRHLSFLVRAELVERKQEGKYNYYKLRRFSIEEGHLLVSLKKVIDGKEWSREDLERIGEVEKKS